MKITKIGSVILFALIILTPLCTFNFETNAASSIDNRMLTENPLTLEGDLTQNIQQYVNDRIGFRDEMITAYTVLNDRAFGKMVHPSYNYGKDGYVFGAGITTYNDFGDYHIAFADMVKSMQDYCEARSVPFLFVLNPAKPAIYQDKIANGINYNREWVDLFFKELDDRGVNYLDNTETMLALRNTNSDGFNRKFDANHWNYNGAFYGTQRILEKMQEQISTIHVNELSEFSVSQKLETSLLVSNFPIEEYVPAITLDTPYKNLADSYTPELVLHPSFQGFGYFVNSQRQNEKTPKALVFQGSYINGYGTEFFINAFHEYIFVHDYQNVINFPYYFNIFQPECVIFEVAEYTFSNTYFDYEKMKAINFNPPLSTLEKNMYACIDSKQEDLTIEEGNTLTKITWNTEQVYPHVWIELDNTYDMLKVEGGYQVTIETNRYESAENSINIYYSI